MQRTSRLVTALVTALSLAVVGVAPAQAAPPDGKASYSIRDIDLDVTVSMADVVTGPAPRVARMWFTFDHPREKLSLRGLGDSAAYIYGPGDGQTQWAYLVKTSEHRAYADFVLSAGSPAGRYRASLDLNMTVDGQTYGIGEHDAFTFDVRRATRTTVAAARSGGKAVVSGRLTRWQPVEYHTAIGRRPHPGASVRLSFDPKGAAGARYVKTVRTDSDGRFRASVRYRGPGRWLASFGGGSAYARSGVRPTGSPEPGPDRSVTRTRTTYQGMTVTMKVDVARNVVVGGSHEKVRVDIAWTGKGPGRLVHDLDEPTYVCVQSRIGRYAFGCHAAKYDGGGRFHVVMHLGPTATAGVYDLSLMRAPNVRTATGVGGAYFPTEQAGSFRVTKATRAKVSVSDSTVRKGDRVAVSGTLRKPSQLDKSFQGGWRGVAGEKVKLYFDPKGSRGPVLKGTDTVDADGRFRRSFTVRESGTWIVKYPGSSTAYLRASSSKVGVSVS